jgi:hypothetical protein
MAGTLSNVETSIRAAIAAGISSEAIATSLARISAWRNGPRVISIKIGVVGRREMIKGLKITSVEAVELRYVDGRWCTAATFYRACLAPGWAADLETFSRRLGHPVLLSRHGASRDYMTLMDAVQTDGMPHCFPVRGCSAQSLCANGSFPGDIGEVASFLNVLGVTPAAIDRAAKAVSEFIPHR